jgi:hypothetical protein
MNKLFPSFLSVLTIGLSLAVMQMTDAVAGAVETVGATDGVGGTSATPVEAPALTESQSGLLKRIEKAMLSGIADVEAFLADGVESLEEFLANKQVEAAADDVSATEVATGGSETAPVPEAVTDPEPTPVTAGGATETNPG